MQTVAAIYYSSNKGRGGTVGNKPEEISRHLEPSSLFDCRQLRPSPLNLPPSPAVKIIFQRLPREENNCPTFENLLRKPELRDVRKGTRC